MKSAGARIVDVLGSLLPEKPRRVRPAPRPTYSFLGFRVGVQFSRRPRIFRLAPSRPRGSGVGENPLYFPSTLP